MLAWIEYPAWHPDFSPQVLASLRLEYDEFFHYDRVHPSVILRSLTCETGPSADINVVRELYNLCKKRIPGAVVEDDSSWIAWNRVHDFYDDHPYGNNQTWVATLDRLKKHISDRETKPLILGESMAADTWCDPKPLLDKVGDKRPFWLPQFLDANVDWLEHMRSVTTADSVQRLFADSSRYALLMRKYQIEAYRREVPYGGYVVSVIRDIPFCGMGLVDFLGREKQSAEDWSWHGDSMLLLKTDNDRRSFKSGSVADNQIYVSHFGDAAESCDGIISLSDENGNPTLARNTLQLGAISCGLNGPYSLRIDSPVVTKPTQYMLQVETTIGGRRVRNRWPIWVVPAATLGEVTKVTLHASVDQANIFGIEPRNLAELDKSSVLITHVIDATVIEHLHKSGNVVLLPNNAPGSLPTQSHWFLRGAPVIDNSKILADVPHDLLLELQHFDLASEVVPEIQNYVELVQPVLLLWDNHDLKHVNTHGLIYRISFPSGGSILVSAINHQHSAAGKYLLTRLIQFQSEPHDARTDQRHQLLFDRLVQESKSRSIRLDQRSWKFSPDASHDGQAHHWHLPEFDDTQWKEIKTTAHWESQGYETLDDWAWYRIKVNIPADWPSHTTFLNFTGVDDYYNLYVNGEYVGQGGDIKKRLTAFDERKSFDVSKWIRPGQDVQIAIEVYDWYGAGGVFRPVTVTTEPLGDQPRILK